MKKKILSLWGITYLTDDRKKLSEVKLAIFEKNSSLIGRKGCKHV